METYYTAKKTAELLGFPISVIYEYVKTGKLAHVPRRSSRDVVRIYRAPIDEMVTNKQIPFSNSPAVLSAPSNLLTTKELAAKLGKTTNSVGGHTNRGEFVRIKVGNRNFYSLDQPKIQELLNTPKEETLFPEHNNEKPLAVVSELLRQIKLYKEALRDREQLIEQCVQQSLDSLVKVEATLRIQKDQLRLALDEKSPNE